MNTNVDIDKLLVSLFNMTPISKENKYLLQEALKKQGLVFNGIEITSIKESKEDDYELVEQKPTDKVEPKFHEGDWVVYNNDICQIVKREEGCNKLVTVFGIEKELVNERNLSTARLWTIQDAKDGDVLAYRDGQWIFIYKEKIDDNSFSYYTLYSTIHQDLTINDAAFTLLGSAINPATKEQRDLLFQKMKEAGYEWDADKKELKKIEDEKYNGEDYGIDSLYHAQRILEKTLGSVEGYQSDDGILEHKCAISAVKKLYEQKPAEWSEEDKKMFVNIKACLRNANKDYSTELDWLKSLKQRIGE